MQEMRSAMQFKVQYIGDDAAEIRKGEIYEAEKLLDCQEMIGVLDRSGEWYAYPKSVFVLVEANCNMNE